MVSGRAWDSARFIRIPIVLLVAIYSGLYVVFEKNYYCDHFNVTRLKTFYID